MYRLEIRKIRQEIEFILTHETNKQVTSGLFIRDLTQLADCLNELIQLQKSISQKQIIKERELKKAMTNISHDIRTPLTSLTGYFQLLNESNSEADRNRYLKIIDNRIKHLENLLENNFIYLKTQDDSYTVDTEKINLNESLQDHLISYYNEFKNIEIEPTINFSDSPVFIQANQEAVSRVLNNLIQNSLVHGCEWITVSLFEEKEKVYLIFENGRQDSERIDIDQIFDRFYKKDAARTVNSTGLGLTIVKELIQNMEGKIEASATPESLKIEITLPSRSLVE